jgi:hypothetical protein
MSSTALPNVARNKNYLHVLATSKTKKRRNCLIDIATTNEINSIVAIIDRIIFKNSKKNCNKKGDSKLQPDNTSSTTTSSSTSSWCDIALSNTDIQHLKRHRRGLRRIVKRKCGVKEQKVIMKGGGLLTSLLPMIIAVVGSLIKRSISGGR